MTHNTPKVSPLLVREGQSSRLGSQVWSPVTKLRSDMGHHVNLCHERLVGLPLCCWIVLVSFRSIPS